MCSNIDDQCNHCHEHTLVHELIVHFPYAVVSVAIALGILSFTSYYSCLGEVANVCKSSKILFHCFHFMHIVFSATGTVITCFRFSQRWGRSLLIGIFSPIVFCALSDSVLPYLGGCALGVNMRFHLCFFTELHNVVPFLLVGIVNGLIMTQHRRSLLPTYSIFSHVGHILVSSLASTFYLVSYGFVQWYSQIGYVFLFLIVAVVLPCTLSDLVVPMMFAKANNGNKEHKA